MGTGNEARWGLGTRLGVAWEQDSEGAASSNKSHSHNYCGLLL